MLRIVAQPEIADQIRRADGQIELVDAEGSRLGTLRRLPTKEEIDFAKSRLGSQGPKATIDELIAKIEAL